MKRHHSALAIDRRELLGAWLVAGLALAAAGAAPLFALRDADPGPGFALRRPAIAAPAHAGAMPLGYDAVDFGEWLSRRGGGAAFAGLTDADS
jgi:hypothetical protein